MLDLQCGCGNPECKSEVMFRRCQVFFEDTTENGWLHLDITDMEGKWIEAMIDPQSARVLLWWMLRNFSLFKKLRVKINRLIRR
jgi:hypothetical protein